MGLVLWIDHNTFSNGLIERVFKKNTLPFYTLPSVEDFSYLVDDLKPVLIVLDGDTFDQNPQAFLDQYEKSSHMQALPFIVLDPKRDFSFLKNKIGELQKPLDAFMLPQILSQILSSN